MLKICVTTNRDNYDNAIDLAQEYLSKEARYKKWPPFPSLQQYQQDDEEMEKPQFRFTDDTGKSRTAIATDLTTHPKTQEVMIEGHSVGENEKITIPIDALLHTDLVLLADYVQNNTKFIILRNTHRHMLADEALQTMPWLIYSFDGDHGEKLISLHIYHNEYYILEITGKSALQDHHMFRVVTEWMETPIPSLAQAEEELFEIYYDEIYGEDDKKDEQAT